MFNICGDVYLVLLCSAIGSCPDLPHLHNGRNIPVSGARGSAYHFKCNRGYKRYGVRVSHCVGDAWSHPSLPVCTSELSAYVQILNPIQAD